jgi:hypothetical protein
VLKDFKNWKLTYKSFKKALKNSKASASVDVEEEDDDKPTLPKSPRGHKAMTSGLKKDVVALVLSETFKGWMADKEEAIVVREEKKCREKEVIVNAFYDLTKKAIEVEESMSKARTIEAEAKLMAEEREIMLVDTTNMTEGQKAWVEKRRAFIV